MMAISSRDELRHFQPINEQNQLQITNHGDLKLTSLFYLTIIDTKQS